MRIARVALVGLLAVGATAPLTAQQSYSSSNVPTTSNGFGAIPGGGWVVGQSFTATNTTLASFGFYAASNWSGIATFQAFLFGMSGSSLVGSPVYASSVMNYGSISTGWFDFLTGGVGLSSGSVYMALLAPVSVASGLAVMDLGTETSNPYTGGAAYTWAGLPLNPSDLTTASWTTLAALTQVTGHDLAFRVDYASEVTTEGGPEVDPFNNDLPTTTTPEPATVVLMGTGLIGLVGAGRIRRKRQG